MKKPAAKKTAAKKPAAKKAAPKKETAKKTAVKETVQEKTAPEKAPELRVYGNETVFVVGNECCHLTEELPVVEAIPLLLTRVGKIIGGFLRFYSGCWIIQTSFRHRGYFNIKFKKNTLFFLKNIIFHTITGIQIF